jgi:hypothetical protein
LGHRRSRSAARESRLFICYEQFLTWPILTALAHQPTVIIAPANAYWARGTPLAARQRGLMAAWSRLFGVPVVSALNE